MNQQGNTQTHRFAWDGISFEVPFDWNLSGYSFNENSSSVQMEDDNALRLDMEWIRPGKPVDQSELQKRCSKVAEELEDAGAETSAIGALSEGWTATMYSMPDGRHLLTAYRLVPDSTFFCILKLHFPAASRREPPRMARIIASSFRIHKEGPVPWEFYDVSFEMNREFRLVNTSFQAGRKMLAFEWRLRRFFIWFFSLADSILKQKPLEEWCAEFTNGFKGIRGPTFVAAGKGEIQSRFTYRYPFGHVEELVRGCLRYHARCLHIPEKNHIVLYVFNYRKQSDLDMIAGVQRGDRVMANGLE